MPTPTATRSDPALLIPGERDLEGSIARSWAELASRSGLFRLARRTLPEPDAMAGVLAWVVLVDEACDLPRDEMLARLGRLRSELGRARAPGSAAMSPLAQVLRVAIGEYGLDPELFAKPLDELEGRADLHAFATVADLEAHARRMAAPAARLVLRVLSQDSERNRALADALGPAVHRTRRLVRFQDHWELGRLVLPLEPLVRSGLDLGALRPLRPSPALANAVAEEVERLRQLYERGWPLAPALGPRAGRWLAFLLRWHTAALLALEARGFDPTRGAPPAGLLRTTACATASLITPRGPRLLDPGIP